MTAFDKSWALLKETIDMHEYPEGSGKFMSLEQMINARNADARRNIDRMDRNLQTVRSPNMGGQPSTNAIQGQNNIMVNSKTGNYDPNDPEGWHPMDN
jgi:hypothetical protein